MSIIYKSLLTTIAVVLLLGLVGCSTVKNDPAPMDPAPKADRG